MTIAASAALALALGGCGDVGDDSGNDSGDHSGSGGDRATPSPTDDAGTPAEPVQVRRVLAIAADACPAAAQPDPAAEALACDDQGTAYRLAPADIVGGVDDAEAVLGSDGTGWTVAVEFDDEAASAFADLARELVGTGQQVAIVAGGTIITAPVIQSAITDGKVQIAGDLDRAGAEALAGELEG